MIESKVKLPEVPKSGLLAGELGISIPETIKKLFEDGYDRGRLDVCEVFEELLHKVYDDSDVEHIEVKDVFKMIRAVKIRIKNVK